MEMNGYFKTGRTATDRTATVRTATRKTAMGKTTKGKLTGQPRNNNKFFFFCGAAATSASLATPSASTPGSDNFTSFCVSSSSPANPREELGCSGLKRKCCQHFYNHHTFIAGENAGKEDKQRRADVDREDGDGQDNEGQDDDGKVYVPTTGNNVANTPTITTPKLAKTQPEEDSRNLN
ncbi:hypothetical protein DAPPUDRAFT_103797 [Daphnia pulex]|uniref:Uncharacterized protein n=1 Tax=Daphnia pulex TaxID=6669 RepID=E9GKB0_DAPPU|nr:hypothetical protein DAPPUDRAFT_103797 [Daphnia pulex]|eukprot:EFX80088.1 hypothetical protein DAPPUDRAFT_103797 [Daphnia pulex]